MALARLDHVIYTVGNIDAAHADLSSRFPEAWPIGRFWPEGRTSGIALGGLNLELIQPDGGQPETLGVTLAFEPDSLGAVMADCSGAGIEASLFEKWEDDPYLLRLRGFDPIASSDRQLICRNLYPIEGATLPFEFFACEYSPFLKDWLSPDNPRLRTTSPVTEVIVGTPDPESATALLRKLDYRGAIRIRFQRTAQIQILDLVNSRGSVGPPR